MSQEASGNRVLNSFINWKKAFGKGKTLKRENFVLQAVRIIVAMIIIEAIKVGTFARAY